MKVTKEQMLEASDKLGCSFRKVAHYVRKYGRLDMNQLSIAIHGESYEPKVQHKEPKCFRCHWPVSHCNCSEHIRKRNRVVWESRK